MGVPRTFREREEKKRMKNSVLAANQKPDGGENKGHTQDTYRKGADSQLGKVLDIWPKHQVLTNFQMMLLTGGWDTRW